MSESVKRGELVRLALAMQFLSIVPIRIRGSVSEDDMRGSTLYYPLAGAMMGGALVGLDFALATVLPSSLVAGFVLLAYAVMTGCLHLDGLADTADGLAAKGDAQRRLAIMRTGAVGPMGVVAVAFALGLKYLALKEGANLTYFAYYYGLLMMPVYARWMMVVLMALGSPAHKDGLGALYIGRLGISRVISATLIAAIVGSGLIAAGGSMASPAWHLYHLDVMLVLGAFALLASRFYNSKFGGLTGDMVGAAAEVAEVIVLTGVLVWSRLYTS